MLVKIKKLIDYIGKNNDIFVTASEVSIVNLW